MLAKFCFLLASFAYAKETNLTEELKKYSTYHKNNDYGQVKNILGSLREKMAKTVPQQSPVTARKMPILANDRSLIPDEDKSELSKNAKIIGDLFEGDVVLTIEQAKRILATADMSLQKINTSAMDSIQKLNSKTRGKRKVIRDSVDRWPGNIVYYVFEDGLGSEKIQVIHAAIQIWETNTCVKFRIGTGNGDYIIFIDGMGCYSSIGRTGGQQEISIGDGCESSGIMSHEIGHALGFWHEQSRYDRNDYVKLEVENIYPLEYGNFARASRQEMHDFDVPYDLGSVMHYGPKAFSDNGMITIRTLDKNYQRTIGQREKLSFADIKQINRAYCSDVCTGILPLCIHGGYPDPSGDGRKCQSCRCPSGFGGSLCDTIEDSKTPTCGGLLIATTDWQTISTPDASPNRHCNWLIKAPPNTKIALEILNMDMRCEMTCYSYLEVKFSINFVSAGNRFCCQNAWRNPIVSESTEMVVIYRTDSSRKNEGNGAQFRCKIDESSASIAADEMSISSTSDQNANGTFGDWTNWSTCTATCGGCGFQTRIRKCSGICNGDVNQRKSCAQSLCPSDTADDNIDSVCRFRTRVPCERFSPDHHARDSRPPMEIPENFDGNADEIDLKPEEKQSHRKTTGQRPVVKGRKKRSKPQRRPIAARNQNARIANDYCNAYAYYPCSRNSPYFYRAMDSDEEKRRNQLGSAGDGQCCGGFEPQGTICVQRKRA